MRSRRATYGDPPNRALLSLDDVSFWYDYSRLPSFYGCSLSLRKNQFSGGCRESGSGKSTLLTRLACGLIQPEMKVEVRSRCRLEGQVLFDGKTVEEPAHSFAYVPQAFEPSLIPTRPLCRNILVAVEADG